MPNLTAKELQALTDQLDFERVIHCKYKTAIQESTDTALKTQFRLWPISTSRTTRVCSTICTNTYP